MSPHELMIKEEQEEVRMHEMRREENLQQKQMRTKLTYQEMSRYNWTEPDNTIQANFTPGVGEDNNSILYVEVALLPGLDEKGLPVGRMIGYIDGGSAITLIHKEVYDSLRLMRYKDHNAPRAQGAGIWTDTQELGDRVTVAVLMRNDSGRAVKVLLTARVVQDLDVPLLIGSGDLHRNDIRVSHKDTSNY